jgi:hypothetical protein
LVILRGNGQEDVVAKVKNLSGREMRGGLGCSVNSPPYLILPPDRSRPFADTRTEVLHR